jgi:hypothetical protein
VSKDHAFFFSFLICSWVSGRTLPLPRLNLLLELLAFPALPLPAFAILVLVVRHRRYLH